MNLNSKDKQLILKITEYGLSRNQFTILELERDLYLTKEDMLFVTLVTSNGAKTDSPNHIIVFIKATKENREHYEKRRGSVDENRIGVAREFSDIFYEPKPDDYYSLLPTAFYNYVDYLEIREARKHADEAKKQSTLALTLTVYAIIISVILGLGDVLLNVFSIFKST